tara:strand:- start:322 stop:939 length:618 start_codon:yes stop_codon:yes gene_type:complete
MKMEILMANNFEKENPGLIDALAEITSWNSFAASLVEQYNKRKTLSEKQTFAAVAMLAKIKQKQSDRKSNMISLDVSKILAVLDKENAPTRIYKGQEIYKRYPKIRVGDFVFSKAKPNSVNAGAVYIKQLGEYIGKVAGGYYLPVGNVSKDTVAEIQEICKNPMESAVAYGRRTGSCAVCARELTVKESIDRGIGPICADKLGII